VVDKVDRVGRPDHNRGLAAAAQPWRAFSPTSPKTCSVGGSVGGSNEPLRSTLTPTGSPTVCCDAHFKRWVNLPAWAMHHCNVLDAGRTSHPTNPVAYLAVATAGPWIGTRASDALLRPLTEF